MPKKTPTTRKKPQRKTTNQTTNKTQKTTNQTTNKTQKPKTKPKKTNHDKLKIVNIVLLMLVVTLTITLLSYIYMEKTNKDTNSTIEEPNIKSPQIQEEYNIDAYKKELEEIRKERQDKYDEQTKRFEEITEDLYKDYIPTIESTKEQKKEIIVVSDKNETHKINENNITKDSNTTKPIIKQEDKKEVIIKKDEVKNTPSKVIDKTNLPKLAIIIDDVTATHELRDIKQIPYTVNISIMPPTKSHKKSADIAKGLDFYMIHFPMQATSFKFEEDNTLHIGDSYEKIEKRVAQIRKWYPHAIYTNNHTGSKFTADKQSMDYLFKALKKYNFIFVDSRTTAQSVAQEMAKKYNMPYIARNIFLDNEQNYKYIQEQLKKSIALAKKKGYAIAIGHPHKMTMKVLRESKPLLEGLELVYVDKIPKR